MQSADTSSSTSATEPLDPKRLKRSVLLKSSDILFGIAQGRGNSILVGSSDARLYEVDLTKDKPERIAFEGEGHRSYITSVVTADAIAITGSYDNQLVWWDLESRGVIRKVAGHGKWIRRLALLPDAKHVISVADDMRCRVWDVSTGQRVADFSDHASMTPHHFPSMLYALAVSADGKHIATGDRIGHVAIWQSSDWSKVAEFEAPAFYTWDPTQRRHSIGGIRSLAFSRDGERLAVGGIGKIGNIDHLDGKSRLEIFDWREGKRLHEVEDEKHKGLVEQICWIADSSYLIAVGGDHKGFINIVDASTGQVAHQEGTDGHIHGCVWAPDLQQLYIAAHERIELWSFAKTA